MNTLSRKRVKVVVIIDSNKMLIVRADASSDIGTGHIMRSIAFAQSWIDSGGEVTFIVSLLPLHLSKIFTYEGIKLIEIGESHGSIEDALRTAEIGISLESSWLVLDGYHFNSDYQRIIKKKGFKILIIDDFGHSEYYYADIILNKGLLSQNINYDNREQYSKLLLGPQYTVLRREFTKWTNWDRKIPIIAKKILVTFGGSDPSNVTLKVIKSLKQIKTIALEVTVVIGPSYKYFNSLNKEISNSSNKFRIKKNVDDMAHLMANSDIAITAGGTTLFELAYMGLPSLVIKIAENQRSSLYFDKVYGTCKFLGTDKELSQEALLDKINYIIKSQSLRKTMSENGKKLINEKGWEKLLKHLND